MKRILAILALAVLAATIGCSNGPHVDKGGGESAVLELENGQPTGRIDVRGHVVNTGGVKALDVVLRFKFYEAGVLYLEEKLLLGDISAGGSASFSGTFFGPAVDPDAFSWEYRIEWD